MRAGMAVLGRAGLMYTVLNRLCYEAPVIRLTSNHTGGLPEFVWQLVLNHHYNEELSVHPDDLFWMKLIVMMVRHPTLCFHTRPLDKGLAMEPTSLILRWPCTALDL